MAGPQNIVDPDKPSADGFRRPNVIRPFDIPGTVDRANQTRYNPDLDPNNYTVIGDSYRDTYWGSLNRVRENMFETDQRADPNFNPIEHIPPGYEQFADAFVYAENMSQVDMIVKQIDRRLENRHRREARSFGQTLFNDVLAGIADPTVFIAAPSMVGRGMVNAFVRGAIGVGSIGAAQETLNYAYDPTMSTEELAWRAGGSIVGSGALMSPLGAVGAKGFKARMLTGTAKPSRYQSLNTASNTTPMRVTIGQARQQFYASVKTAESSGKKFARPIDPKTGKARSSAKGLFQITNDTWRRFGGSADPAKRYDPAEQQRVMDKLTDYNQNQLLKAGLPVTAGTLYLAHFLGDAGAIKVLKASPNARLDGLVDPAALKANPEVFAKNKTPADLVAWASRKMGESPQGAGRFAMNAYSANNRPRVVRMDGNNIVDVVEGPTGVIDANGRYRPAAYIHEQHKADEFTVHPVKERPERFKQFDEMADDAAPTERPGRAEGQEMTHQRTGAEPPQKRVTVEVPSAPPKTSAEAATELDRLDRGDAIAVDKMVDASYSYTKDEPFDGTVRHYVRKYMRGEGRDDPEMLQFAINNAEAIEAEFKRFLYMQQSARASDNLPFTSKQQEMMAGMSNEDVRFLTDTVKAKGLGALDKDELVKLRDIIYSQSKKRPEIAQMWMGKMWDGKSKLGKARILKRLEQLHLNRRDLGERAPEYQRDVDSIYDPNYDRQRLAAARAENSERIEIQRNRINELHIQEDEALKDMDSLEAGQALRAEWEAKMELQYALLGKLLDIREQIANESAAVARNRNVIDGVQSHQNRSRFRRVKRWTEKWNKDTRQMEAGFHNVWIEEINDGSEVMTGLETAKGQVNRSGQTDSNFQEVFDEASDPLFDQAFDLVTLNRAQRAMDRMREQNREALVAELEDRLNQIRQMEDDVEAIGRGNDLDVVMVWKTNQAEARYNKLSKELDELEGDRLDDGMWASPESEVRHAIVSEEIAQLMDTQLAGREVRDPPVEIVWKTPEAEARFNAIAKEMEELENALATQSSKPEREILERQIAVKQELINKLRRNSMVEISPGEVAFIEGKMSPKQQALQSKLAQEVRDLDERLAQLEVYDSAHNDLLPFGIDLKGQEPPVRNGDYEGGYLAIDTDALRQSFADKPWTVGHDGVAGLPEDAFQTPEDWINFVYFHEREHVLNLRQEGESLADYENRINARALELTYSQDAPWKPMDSWAEELVLRPTPIGQIMHMVKNPMNYIYESLARLASDYDLRLQRNLKTGGYSQQGGSVYQRALKWQAKSVEYFRFMSDQFLIYRRGTAADGTIGRAVGVFRHRKAIDGKMSFDEFDKAVGRVQASGKKSGIPEVDAAANKLNDLFKEIHAEQDKLGMFRAKERLRKELDARKATLEMLRDRPNPTPRTINRIINTEAEIEDLEYQLANYKETAGHRSLTYFERIWNPAAIIKQKDEFIRIVANGFMKPIEAGGYSMAAREANLRAKNIFDELTKDPSGSSIEVGSRPGSTRGRQIPVENDEVLDFIHLNSSVVMARHMRKTGAAVEMFREFGDEAGDAEADRVLASLEADGLSDEVVRESMQIWYDMRDRIIGGFHGDNPMSTSNRIVRGVKRFTRIAVMGLSGFSQLPDLAKAAWVSGPESLAKGAFAPMIGAMQGMDPGKYAHAVGEALDIEMSILSRRMMDEDDWSFLNKETAVERWLADVEIPFFIFNGVGPMTVMLKRAVARAAPHLALDRAIRVAEAVRAGKEVPMDDATWLKEYGIDEYDAMLLVDLPRQSTPSGFMYVDLDEWANLGRKGARGKQLLEGMISGHVRRSVSTPGPLNRPRIMDGIMIDKKARKAAWEERWKAADEEERARQVVIAMRKNGLSETNPRFIAAVEALKEAAGNHKRARLNVGSKARKERPLLSLPFQLQSFSMSQASKLAHAAISNRDKHRFLGLMSLWGAGIISVWLKGLPIFTNSNENASLDEFITRGFNASGMMTWLTIPWEGAKSLGRLATEEGTITNAIFGEDRPGAQDDLGLLGPGTGLMIGAMEAVIGQGLGGADLAAQDRIYRAKRLVPFGNLLYFQWLTNIIFDQAGQIASGEEGTEQVDDMPFNDYQRDDVSKMPQGLQQMFGFEIGENHRFSDDLPEPPPEWSGQADPTGEELLKQFNWEIAKKRSRKKVRGRSAFDQQTGALNR